MNAIKIFARNRNCCALNSIIWVIRVRIDFFFISICNFNPSLIECVVFMWLSLEANINYWNVRMMVSKNGRDRPIRQTETEDDSRLAFMGEIRFLWEFFFDLWLILCTSLSTNCIYMYYRWFCFLFSFNINNFKPK